jgi:hypothetical protein
MGFNNLREETRFPVVEIDSKKYAVRINTIRPKISKNLIFDEEDWMEDLRYGFFRLFRRGMIFQIMGIEIDVLKSFLKVMREGNGSELMSLEPKESPKSENISDFIGSFFKDGTILRKVQVSESHPGKFPFRTEVL